MPFKAIFIFFNSKSQEYNSTKQGMQKTHKLLHKSTC